MRPYPYVGPADIKARVVGRPAGTRIRSAADLLAWVNSTDQRPGPDGLVAATFAIDASGDLFLADRRSEHVACAGGGPVLSAGEMFFVLIEDSVEVVVAYRLLPVQFDGGEQRPFAIPLLAVQPLPDCYRRLGYDAVSRSCGSTFECSPLSCNYAANKVKVNGHCLVNDRDEAFRLVVLFYRSEEGYEPGPYFIVEVWRREEGS